MARAAMEVTSNRSAGPSFNDHFQTTHEVSNEPQASFETRFNEVDGVKFL